MAETIALMRKKFAVNGSWVHYSGYIAFVFILVFFTIKSKIFLTPNNISNILIQSSPLGVVGCGMATILLGGGSHILRGGIDLSLADNIAFGVGIMAIMIQTQQSFLAGFALVLLVGLIIGIINAYAIVKLNVIPLVGTLAMMYVLKGGAMLVTNNVYIIVDNPILNFIGKGNILGIPVMVLIFVLVSIIMYLAINRTAYGNWLSAAGGNTEVAKISGVKVGTVIASTYVIASLTAAISAVLVSARVSGSVRGIGDSMLMDVLLVGYLSAIFSRAGIPSIPGAIISALFVGTLTNGFTLINFPTFWVYAIKGVLILVAVSVTTKTRKGV
ncbi:MAG: ABC transporter permease [Dehalobacterium sp.]|jgi:ribose transport system permease protein